jgi:hypothetical protein
VTEPTTVSGLSAVALSGSGRVVIEQTGVESLTVMTDDNLLPHIKAEVTRHTLDLGFKDSFIRFRPTQDILFKVTVKQLDELQVSGSGGALVAASDRLDVRVSGSGSIEYVGDPAVTQHISGSGSVHRR